MFWLVRRLAIVTWLVTIAIGFGYYLTHREAFAAVAIAASLRNWAEFILVGYLIVSVLRALVLIPSTPFVVAGGLLLPGHPAQVLGISMLGIALSATLIYYVASALGFREFFERGHARSLRTMEQVLQGRFGFVGLVIWSFFPLAPTDAACYVAGTIRMQFWKYLTAVCLGELVICSMYVYLGRGIGSLIW